MEGASFDEGDIFRAVATSGARALLIGRQALIALGLPMMTADIDFWIHIDDIEKLNAALLAVDQLPNRAPAEARALGRYVSENGHRVDVMVARGKSLPDGSNLTFDEAWRRRQSLEVFDTTIYLPSLDDLITTKRWGSRARDLADIQWLEALKQQLGSTR